ncbi:MAG: hypothetical protein A2Z86_03550 [Candidatus Glassbacteria bacterium GWA2_58_10]|uniref:Glycoside hydrolase n=2 Tax=Candidatus Glassiibacteriota TaxID=1817805 RepID=A0A1F5YFY0_9BACT|nr:MAG: hypothetical protein A2Z86_03550 [Candidatus Glassbacteria bacterium GWA2_58_10]
MQRKEFLLGAAGAAISLASTAQLIGGAQVNMDSAFKLQTGQALADPCLLNAGDSYYLIGTGQSRRPRESGLAFDLYQSPDLLSWKNLGPVLKLPEFEGSREGNYWAPEILPFGGKFYLYYTADSFGNPEKRFVRVALAERIEGPYEDSGQKLTAEPSIDGHPAYANPAEGYLFYTGNEGNRNVGQLMVDRLITPLQTANEPVKVFPEETVPWEEGPFTWQHGGSTYLFTSMGNWRDGSYHILVSRADKTGGPFQRLTRADGNANVLATHEAEQSGPGHNSIFSGPGGKTFICYHAWDSGHTGRYPWAAPLEWVDGFPVAKQ